MRPERLDLSDDGAALTIHWPGGEADTLSAPHLRAHARDALSVRQRHDGTAPAVAPGLTIAQMQTVGAMGVNLVFSDGHDRAIYPWAWLREIAVAEAHSGAGAENAIN